MQLCTTGALQEQTELSPSSCVCSVSVQHWQIAAWWKAAQHPGNTWFMEKEQHVLNRGTSGK